MHIYTCVGLDSAPYEYLYQTLGNFSPICGRGLAGDPIALACEIHIVNIILVVKFNTIAAYIFLESASSLCV